MKKIFLLHNGDVRLKIQMYWYLKIKASKLISSRKDEAVLSVCI